MALYVKMSENIFLIFYLYYCIVDAITLYGRSTLFIYYSFVNMYTIFEILYVYEWRVMNAG